MDTLTVIVLQLHNEVCGGKLISRLGATTFDIRDIKFFGCTNVLWSRNRAKEARTPPPKRVVSGHPSSQVIHLKKKFLFMGTIV